MPRAAISVATNAMILPFLKLSSAFCLAPCDLSPWIAMAVTPAALSFRASLSAPYLVRVNTRQGVSTLPVLNSSIKSSVLLALSVKYTDCSVSSTVLDTGVTATEAGFTSSDFASLSISGGIVAVKNIVCFFCGSSAITFLTSWIKPMSSMRSASSSTKNSTPERSTCRCDCRSSSRPGVATSTSTPR